MFLNRKSDTTMQIPYKVNLLATYNSILALLSQFSHSVQADIVIKPEVKGSFF